jgi:hypothetical protein
MSESQYFCPRLIDYLAIVGAHPNSSKRRSLYELQNCNEEYSSGISSTSVNNDDNFFIQVLLNHFVFKFTKLFFIIHLD